MVSPSHSIHPPLPPQDAWPQGPDETRGAGPKERERQKVVHRVTHLILEDENSESDKEVTEWAEKYKKETAKYRKETEK